MPRPLAPLAPLALGLALAASAHAQPVGIDIEVGQPVLEPGQSTTVTLIARFDPADHALAGVATALGFTGLAAEPRDHWSGLQVLPPLGGPSPSGPILGATAIEGILAGQLHFPPAMIYADPSNPIAFFEATFTAPADAGGGYRVDLLTDTARFDVYIDRAVSTSEPRLDLLVEGSGSILVIPAPASALALALAAPLAARRRRPPQAQPHRPEAPLA